MSLSEGVEIDRITVGRDFIKRFEMELAWPTSRFDNEFKITGFSDVFSGGLSIGNHNGGEKIFAIYRAEVGGEDSWSI